MTQPIASPCINRCRLDPDTGWCEGCLRTIDEITRWARIGETARQAVWNVLPVRRAQRDSPKPAEHRGSRNIPEEPT